MADDLAAWLTQIWDEQERIARAATASPWRYNAQKHTHLPGSVFFEEGVFAGEAGAAATTIAATGETDDPQSMADARFIAANDPASVLARIAAARQILALCKATLNAGDEYEDVHRTDLWYVMRYLASAHADRPGYQEAWKP